MKRAIILGSGNAFHGDGRAQSSIYLESIRGEGLVVDFGSGALATLRSRHPELLDRIHTIVFTHYHGDHFAGIPFLLLTLGIEKGRTVSVHLLGPTGLNESVKKWIHLATPGWECPFPLVFDEIAPNEEESINGFRLQGRRIHHRPESLGYRITGPGGRSVAISGDTPLDGALLDLVRGVDVAFIECSFVTRPETPLSHISCEEIEIHREEIQAKKIRFVHLDDAAAECVESLLPGSATRDGEEILFSEDA